MAYRRRFGRGSSNTRVIMRTLGGLTGLMLSLYVFHQVLTTVVPLVNVSGGYFSTTVDFVTDILPVVGIIAGYIMIRGAINRMTI